MSAADPVKESISDIINQLQDIDPARLSFSPFLDLDTQISLAPVSDSPESSVEELRSASGSQRSLEPPPPPAAAAAGQPRSSDRCHQQPSASLPAHGGAASLTAPPPPPPPPASQGDVPNGTNTPGWSPGSTAPESRPLIGRPRESVELAVWPRPDAAAEEAADPGRRRRCRRCRRWGGRLPAVLSVLASLLCAAAMLYALYFYVPIRPPDCPDVSSRMVFTLCCGAVAALPVLLAMLTGAACQLCPGSPGPPPEPTPRRSELQRRFVASSLELLLLYLLNLLVMASLLPEEELKLVPVLVVMFIAGRLVFWLSLNTCGSWRGFGSGLTVFPLLAVVALNLFLMYKLNLKQPLFGPQDAPYNRVASSSGSAPPTDTLDAQ